VIWEDIKLSEKAILEPMKAGTSRIGSLSKLFIFQIEGFERRYLASGEKRTDNGRHRYP